MKVCRECGAVSPGDMDFCSKCGSTKVDWASEQDASSVQKTSSGSGISPMTVILVLLTVMMLFSMYSSSLINPNSGNIDGLDKTYEWKYSVVGSEKDTFDCSVKLSIDKDSYKAARDSNIERGPTSKAMTESGSDIVKKFVVIDQNVNSLAKSLAAEYKRIMNQIPDKTLDNSYQFNQFILTFVEHIVVYTEDIKQHNKDEYWAYPVQTLYSQKGDCEDTSLLASALYQALASDEIGKDYVKGACLIILTSHAMVGVQLTGEPAPSLFINYPCYVELNGVKYIMGETTGSPESTGTSIRLGCCITGYLSGKTTQHTGFSSVYE